MKYLCVNNKSVTLPVAKGYPNEIPPNGNMSLLFKTEITMASFDSPEFLSAPGHPLGGMRFAMEVGEVYDASEEKVNFYGIPMLLFPVYYGWRPKCCFIEFEPEVEEAEAVNESELGFSISPELKTFLEKISGMEYED